MLSACRCYEIFRNYLYTYQSVSIDIWADGWKRDTLRKKILIILVDLNKTFKKCWYNYDFKGTIDIYCNI